MQHRNGKQTFCDHLLKKTFKEIKVFKISIISWTSSSDHLAVLGWVKAPRTLVMYTLMFPPRSSLWFFLGIFDLYKHYTLDFWPWATWKFLTYTVQVVQMPTLIKWCRKPRRFYAKTCTSPLSPTSGWSGLTYTWWVATKRESINSHTPGQQTFRRSTQDSLKSKFEWHTSFLDIDHFSKKFTRDWVESAPDKFSYEPLYKISND